MPPIRWRPAVFGCPGFANGRLVRAVCERTSGNGAVQRGTRRMDRPHKMRMVRMIADL